MKITRKKFLQQSLLTALGIGIIPKAFSLASNKLTLPGTRELGKTGVKVTPLGMGASRTQEPAVLRAALDRGITFLDTGRSYAHGQNEVMIGKTLKGIRSRYVIQSKMKVSVDNGSDRQEIRRQMENSLQESLKALQTDYIDVMLLHGVRQEEIIRNETIRKVFSEMKQRGAIRACGFSSHINHVEVLREANKDHFFDVAMVPFNPAGAFQHSQSDWSTSWNQPALVELMQKAHRNGMGIVAMKTCSGGPYALLKGDQASYSGAVRWVLEHDFVDTSAVAMASFREINEHTKERP
ncbi:MAG: aldo/keto reductase [Bacteroidales bacterium]|nr:aldo/keto reductase [Bacteroidales bacterium]